MRVVGEGVETWHEVGEVAEDVRERWFGGGKGMEKLQERDIRASPESSLGVMIVSTMFHKWPYR